MLATGHHIQEIELLHVAFKDPEYKPSFSGHETFSLRYGWLQKAFEEVNELSDGAINNRLLRDPALIARMGVGKNMVASIWHWSKAVGILEELETNKIVPSKLADLLFGSEGVDRYLEGEGSLWLLHWHLVSLPAQTSFYWLFNLYRGGSFSRKEIVDSLVSLSEQRGWHRAAATTIDRDVQCLLRSYVGGRGEADASESILAELGLIRPLGQGRYTLTRGQRPNLPDQVFLFAVWDFWIKSKSDRSTLSFEALAFDAGSPGCAFMLDENSLVERLEILGDVSGGKFSWSETAGLRQVVRNCELDDFSIFESLRSSLVFQPWEQENG